MNGFVLVRSAEQYLPSFIYTLKPSERACTKLSMIASNSLEECTNSGVYGTSCVVVIGVRIK